MHVRRCQMVPLQIILESGTKNSPRALPHRICQWSDERSRRLRIRKGRGGLVFAWVRRLPPIATQDPGHQAQGPPSGPKPRPWHEGP